MAHFDDRAGFTKDNQAAHGFPAGAVVGLIALVVLCVLGFLLRFGEDLTAEVGSYEAAPMALIGP
jgi:hypothetical protein